MTLKHLLLRGALATVFFFALLFAVVVAKVIFYVVSGIAYSGSTGMAHAAFVENVAPLGRFLLCFLVFGGVGVVINAFWPTSRVWPQAIIGFAVLGGAASLALPSMGQELHDLILSAFE
ncbi:hypothetical protein [Montanilutibacter psychrotolerans]|uniref:Uncharacterized protein n=1 Tax=Montanilutibacter psychrotolerans TaxID=1327343 RepID=A0A3M8ST44_9GAMM|nr:hypothetical protein [Lysobacter psychrotolerans]RNF84481.1 hypothetical protein EER27_08930 [Lysobacter psychrotolerans]